MSWVDVVSAALGATGQGLGQHTQIDRQRKQLMLDQMEQERRQRAVEQEMMLKTIVPGAAIDPETLQTATQLGLKNRIGKGEDGSAIWALTPEDTLNNKRIERESLLIQDAKVRGELSAKELAARDFIEKNPEQFFSQPPERRGVAWASAGYPGQAPLSQEEFAERQKANDWLPYQAALARANGSGGGELNELRKMQQLQIAMKLIESRYGADSETGKLMLQRDPQRKAAFDQEMATLVQQAQGPIQSAPAAGGDGGTVSVMAPNGEVRHGIPAALAQQMVAAGGKIVQ